MKILITGSLGLVGSACVSLFKVKGWEVVGVDSNMRSSFFGTKQGSGWETREIDIRDSLGIDNLFKDHKFDAIIHTAGQPSHDYATDHVLEDFEINTRGTLNLLEATRKYCPEATFVFVSTDKVYGENMRGEGTPFNETLGLDFAGVRSLFGCSKTAADIYVQEYGNRFGIKTACFRPGCITGRNHQGAEQHGFLAYLAKSIKTGKEYKIFGNGETVRDQIHANDLAQAFWHFIQNPKVAAVYNMGGGPERAVSIVGAITLIEEETGKTCAYNFYPERIGDRRWDAHDISKFRHDYPQWDYQYSLQDIIKDICA